MNFAATPPSARPAPEAPARPRIGVLLPEMDGDYYRPIVASVCRQAARLDVDLVFYPGGHPGSPVRFEQQRGAAFELVDGDLVDGLLVFASSLQHHLGAAGLGGLLDRFEHLPLVTIGVEHHARPSVLLDNRTGFADLVRHLAQVHGHRRIAMIEGPVGNRDAQERLAAYLSALRAAGLDADPALRIVGDFSEAAGRAAIEALWRRGVPFTAVVCASDEVAHAVLAAATERGLRVPGDLAVGGFDDLLSIQLAGPSLTTVNQDLESQGATALALLVSELRGDTVPLLTPIASRLVVRRSCGCSAGLTLAGALATTPADLPGLAAAIDPPEPLAPTLAADLAALRDALALPSGEPFEAALRDLAARWLRHRADLAPLHALLLHLGAHLPPLAAAHGARAAARLQEGQLVLVNARELSDNQTRVTARAHDLDFRDELKRRITTDHLDALLVELDGGLAQLGVDTCLIALYREPLSLAQMRTEGLPSSSRLILARHGGGARPDWLNVDFATCRLAPVDVSAGAAPTARVVLPLFSLQSQFGFAVIDVRHDRPLRFEALRHELSAHVHHCLLVQQLAEARDLLRSDLDRAQRDNAALSHLAMRDELTGLFNRRGFFELAQARLATSRVTGKPVTLLFADLDGLKQVNDTHGHEEGDAAIRAAADVLRVTFRQDDIVSRIGGDEFVALTPMHSLDSLPEIERRLTQAFDEHNRRAGKPYVLGCSLGGYAIPLDSKESLDDILAQADRLLYAAKRRKRARAEGRSSKF